MKLQMAVVLIAVAYIIAFFSHAWHLQKTTYGDGIFYYSWLRSIVVDHDINFTNEYADNRVSQPKTSLGYAGNKYSVGPAIFWSPLYITVHNIVRGNGWELPYQLATGITSVLASLVGLALLLRILHTSLPVRTLTVLAIAGASNLLFYGAIDPVNSHALSFFAAVVYLSLISAKKHHWFAIGITLAFIASIRNQDALYVLALIPIWKQIHWRSFILGAVLGFLPQLAAWISLYGSIANPYIAGGETFDLLRPHILGVLFGLSSGLFLWTPVTAIGFIGLALRDTIHPTHNRKRIIYLIMFCLQVYLVASWSTWWQGASVSGRMFVSALPLLAFGLGSIIERIYTNRLLRTILPLLILALSMLNGIGIFYYLFTY
jgi:hypothetical protein